MAFDFNAEMLFPLFLIAVGCVLFQRFFRKKLSRDQYFYVRDLSLTAVLMLLAVLAGCAQQSAPAAEQPEAKAGRLLLFTTKTCPKCVMAKKFLADAGIVYDLCVVDDDPDTARRYGVRQAPTLLVLDGETEVQRVENPSNIRAFAEKQTVRL